MTQDELRNLLIEHTRKGTQQYISEQVKIDRSTLSKFKNGKIDLYPDLFQRLCDFFGDNK